MSAGNKHPASGEGSSQPPLAPHSDKSESPIMTTPTDLARAQEAMPELLPCPSELLQAAANYLETYADFIRRTCPINLEEHPYVPDLDEAIKDLRAAVEQAAVAVPEGWKWVPVEPTPEMLKATSLTPGMKIINDVLALHQGRGYPLPGLGNTPETSAMGQAYRAMLAAAPEVNRDQVHSDSGGSSGVQLQLGPVAFEFSSFQRWVDKARNWFINLAATNRNAAQKRYLSIDAAGRVCMIGADFMRARDENTFPVRVYLIDAEPAPRPDAPTSQMKKAPADQSGYHNPTRIAAWNAANPDVNPGSAPREDGHGS